MGKILVIAEKPSVGRDLARVLRCGQKGDGWLASETHVVSWAVGHLVTLFEPEDYDARLKKWRTATLPIIPEAMRLKAVTQTRKQFDILARLMNSPQTDALICATDSGREGELIFRYIYQLAGCRKPFTRLWISSMTDAAIQEGFRKLKPGAAYDNLYESARCRSEADWLVGMNATRAYTIAGDELLPIGRVQTPTLAMMVARRLEIEAFTPVEYYEVTADFGSYAGKWYDEANNDTKIYEADQADDIVKRVKGKTGAVTLAETEEKRQPPPQLYDLTELQRDANRKYGLSAKDTLAAAQTLYEKRKLITYPRTDSRHLSEDMIPTLPRLLKRLTGVPRLAAYAEFVLGLTPLPITKRIVDDAKVTDHHAIIPTDKSTDVNALPAQERNVYDLVARRFIAAFYPPYIYNATKLITTVENEPFISRGVMVTQMGWTELYQDDDKKGEDPPLPLLKEGDAQTAHTTKRDKKKTLPPKPYTDATLLSAMEHAGRFVEDEALKEQLKENGLGTPATRAGIIERLLAVGYAARKGKTLNATDKAVRLMGVVPPELRSPEMTGRWERGLAAVARGDMRPERFMGSIQRFARYLVEQARAEAVPATSATASRKENRLEDYDYANEGLYFVTICAKDLQCLFGDPETTALTPLGKIVEETILRAERGNVKIPYYAVMPNHVHMIVALNQVSGAQGRAPLQNVVHNIKAYVTRTSKTAPWQKSFHDHIVRDEADYKRIATYIKNNPQKWADDRYHTPQEQSKE